MPRSTLVPACSPPSAGVLSVIALEAGWVVTEVGRQPWIVYEYMKVEDAVTETPAVWIMFSRCSLLYTALAVTTSSCCAA